MAGMIDESMDDPEKLTGAPDEFMSKNTAQKALVITAGVLMNFILAMGIYSVVTMSEGVPEVKDPVVAAVSPGFPADAAGIQAGARIVEIDGMAITTWDELVDIIHASPEMPIQVAWELEGERQQAEIIPKLDKAPVDGEIREVGLIGIAPKASFRPAGFLESLSTGVILTYQNLKLGVTSISMLVTGKASVKDLGGPITIAKWSGESARGGFTALVLFIAFISINIGLLNILPIPVLDGGHLVMILIEGATRRPISTRIKVAVQQVGMVLLLALMAVIIWNDAGRVGWLSKIKELF
jgi:regulator of sigma E protease